MKFNFSSKKRLAMFDIQVGAYYEVKTAGNRYHYFRLIDIEGDGITIHVEDFETNGSKIKGTDKIKSLKPAIMHQSSSISDFLDYVSVNIVAHEAYNKKDLYAFDVFLSNAREMNEADIDEVLNSVVEKSKDSPFTITIEGTKDDFITKVIS